MKSGLPTNREYAVIRASNVRKRYGNLEVLKGIDLEIPQGLVVSIVGPSGAGKTTLLQILGTLIKPSNQDYTLQINGKETKHLSAKEAAKLRNREIGFVFQFHNLLPEFTALENVAIPAYIAGEKKKAADERATYWLEKLGLVERLTHKPSELSGGEQQRVAVARALINDPAVILADEPSGNLDSVNARRLHELFFRLQEETGKTFVIVTHNDELASMSHRIFRMQDGMMVDDIRN